MSLLGSRFVVAFVLVSVLFGGVRSLSAQNISTAQLAGTVRDPQGAVIPGATVTVTDPSKGFSRSVTTDAQGNYQLLELPPGEYTVTVTAPGFATQRTDVVLTVGA